MQRLFNVLVVTILIAAFAFSASAQKPKSKDQYFKEISTLSNTKNPEDKEKAYELGKEFFVNYPNEKGDNINKLRDFLKRFRNNKFYQTVDAKQFAEAFAIGKEILTEEPDNPSVTMNLAYSGYDALASKGDKTFAENALQYSKKTLDLLEKGVFPANFAPFLTKEDAIAWMYYITGTFTSEKDLRESAINFYKATLYESQVGKSSQPYYMIAAYFEEAFAKASKDLNDKVTAKSISDSDYKIENEKVNKIINRMLDGYARAYTIGSAEKNPDAPAWKERLTEIYKYQKKTTEGLDSFIVYINNTPLADPSSY